MLFPEIHGQLIVTALNIEKSQLRGKSNNEGTVEPRLTNTLLKRTPHLNERFWPVPNIFPVKSSLKTPLWANNPALPAQRTAVCPPKVSVCEVFTLKLNKTSWLSPQFFKTCLFQASTRFMNNSVNVWMPLHLTGQAAMLWRHYPHNRLHKTVWSFVLWIESWSDQLFSVEGSAPLKYWPQ